MEKRRKRRAGKPIRKTQVREDLPSMSITPISGAAAAAASTAATPQKQQAPAAQTQNRATAQDTVTISAAGQQAAKAGGDADHDGDSQ